MKRNLTIFLLILLAVVAFMVLLIVPSRKRVATDSGQSLRVVTANILYTNTHTDLITKAIMDLDPDIVLVLERTGMNLSETTLENAGYVIVADSRRPGTAGSCFIVRDDLSVDTKVVAGPVVGSCTMPIATMRMKWKSRSLSLVGMHARPPTRKCREKSEKFLDWLGGLVSQGHLARDLGEARTDDPIVLLGDLNALPFSDSIQRIKDAGLLDACAGANSLPLLTWRPRQWLPAIVRLDHILHSDGIRSRDVRVLEIPGSDHRLVVSDLEWACDQGLAKDSSVAHKRGS